LDRPSRCRDLLDRVAVEEGDPLTIGREDRQLRVTQAGDRPRLQSIECANDERPRAADIDDLRRIGRDRQRTAGKVSP
jgi:hypothetical protein